jgi:hypothetical protein
MNREPSTYNQPETRRDNYKLTVPLPVFVTVRLAVIVSAAANLQAAKTKPA